MENKQIIQPDEVKIILIRLLEYFDIVCKKNNIQYSLGYGTLLGAARHGGFIPWDDDIDVMLPEPDYKRLLELPELRQQDAQFQLHTIATEKHFCEIYPYPFAKLVDEKTYGEYMRTKDKFGAYIDIFPVIGVPDDTKKREQFFREFEKNKLSLAIGYRIDRDRKNTFIQKLRNIRRNYYWRHYQVFREKLVENMFMYSFEGSKMVNVSYWNFGEREVFPRELFSEYISLPFEGKMYPCIKRYDDYLTQMYGDWHKLPPESSRTPRHEYLLFYR